MSSSSPSHSPFYPFALTRDLSCGSSSSLVLHLMDKNLVTVGGNSCVEDRLESIIAEKNLEIENLRQQLAKNLKLSNKNKP